MKTNIKFFGTILLLLLASSVILTGCMYAIAAEKGRTKSYDMGSRIENSEGTVAEGGAPTAQAELQKKFSSIEEQKEALYADYGKLKKQVAEYDVIKRNIDSILQAEKQPERKRETER